MNNNKSKTTILGELCSLDFLDLFLLLNSFITGGILLYSKIDSLKTNYKLKKDFTPRGGSIVTISDEDKQRIDDFNIDEISKINHAKEIFHFINVVEKNFKSEDLAFMVNNLNKLKVNNFKLEDYLKIDGTKGYYTFSKNAVYLIKKNPEEFIYHELFHAASSIGEDDTYCVGFANVTKYGSLGVGLNEGYTQNLTKRYFPSKTSDLSYPYLTKIANILEQIIGKDDMQSMYMRGELNVLFKKIKNYVEHKDAIHFVILLDNIMDYLYKRGLNSESVEIINQALYEVNVILTRIIINKAILDTDNNSLNIHDIYAKCMPLIHQLPAKLDFVKFKCNFWDNKIAHETISEELELALDLNIKRK